MVERHNCPQCGAWLHFMGPRTPEGRTVLFCPLGHVIVLLLGLEVQIIHLDNWAGDIAFYRRKALQYGWNPRDEPRDEPQPLSEEPREREGRRLDGGTYRDAATL